MLACRMVGLGMLAKKNGKFCHLSPVLNSVSLMGGLLFILGVTPCIFPYKPYSLRKSILNKNSPGCIINVASLLGLKGGRGSSAYAASKAGVIGKLPMSEKRIQLTKTSRFHARPSSRSRRKGDPSKRNSPRIHRNRHDNQ